MATAFDMNKFEDNVKKLCGEFSANYVITEKIISGYTLSHSVQDGDQKYALEYLSKHKRISFTHRFEGESVLQCLISVQEFSITDEYMEDDFYVSQNSSDKADTKKLLLDTIKNSLTDNSDTLKVCINQVVAEHTWNISADDIKEALEKSFDEYTNDLHDTEILTAHTVVTRHKNVEIRIDYIDTEGQHDALEILVQSVQENYVKQIYVCDFSFTQLELSNEYGTKPDGFDEGFTKFKLLGALMT